RGASEYSGVYTILFFSGLLTAGLTAFYTFRAYFLTFWGEERIPHEAGEHAHESPPVMTIPLSILAISAVGAGFFVWAFTQLITRTPGFGVVHEAEVSHLLLVVESILVVAAGIGLAWWLYYRNLGLADRWAANIQALYQLSLNKFHVDELYYAFF